MRIPPLTDLTDVLWEGPLELPAGMKGLESTGRGDDAAVLVSIGAPSVWADQQLLGEKWQRPLGGGRYHLARFAFTLRPEGRAVISDADFCLTLQSAGATVYDAFPLQETVEQAREVTLGLSPTLKLGEVEAVVGNAEVTIDMGRIIPVVQAYGLAEARFCWRFTAHRRYPLTGSRVAVAVIHLPEGLPWAGATLELAATVETRFGPLRLSTAESAAQPLRIAIGQ